MSNDVPHTLDTAATLTFYRWPDGHCRLASKGMTRRAAVGLVADWLKRTMSGDFSARHNFGDKVEEVDKWLAEDDAKERAKSHDPQS